MVHDDTLGRYLYLYDVETDQDEKNKLYYEMLGYALSLQIFRDEFRRLSVKEVVTEDKLGDR